MSTDLEKFRDHCRAMADSDAKVAAAIEIKTDEDLVAVIRFADDADLWTRLADEADHFLEHGFEEPDDNDLPLWENA